MPPSTVLWRWRLEGAAVAFAVYAVFLVPFTLFQSARSAWIGLPSEWLAVQVSWEEVSRRVHPWSARAMVPSEVPSAAQEAVVGAALADIPSRLRAIGAPFLELAARAEGFRSTVYRDTAGWNIGFGYCLTCRARSDSGAARRELAAAGLRPADVDALIAGPDSLRKAVVVTPFQAIRLLEIVGAQSRSAARRTIGASFNRLPAHRQAALTWLAYNTGAAGFGKFHSLHDAVRRDDTLVVVAEIIPSYRTLSGHFKLNTRAGRLLQAAYTTPSPAPSILPAPY